MNRTIDITAPLKLDDGDYYVVRVQGGSYHLRHAISGDYSVMAAWELPLRLADPVARFDANPRQLDTIAKSERSDLNFWAEHLRELDSGYKTAASQLNPIYNPAEYGANKRIAAKLEELEALGKKTSRSSLLRKRAKFKEGGITALIDGRELRSETPIDGADERIIVALRKRVNGAARKSTQTKLGHIAEAIKEVSDAHPGIYIPSESTLYRWFNYLATGKQIKGTSANRKSLDAVPKRVFGDTRKYFPGQYVEIDSTVLDCLVYDEDGNFGRPTLTIMIDVCTRSIIAFSFRLVAAKAVDHAFLLAQALTPRRLRPNSDKAWRTVLMRFPWVDLVSVEDRDLLDDTLPFIKPRCITVDHGTDYTGTVFEAACALFEIDLIYAAPGTPTDKNHVERAFSTIKTGFVEHIATFTGGSPGNRGDIEDEPMFDLVTLDQLFSEWVTRVYQNSPNDGLFDPYRPSVLLTPNQMYMAAWDLAPSQPVPMDTVDYIALLPAERRTIQAQGIQYQNRYYDSVELQSFRSAAPRMDGTGNPVNDWEFRANPYDPRAIWLLTPDKQWLEVPWRHRASVDQPHQTQLWNEANRIRSAYPSKFTALERRLTVLEMLEDAGKGTVTINHLRAQQKAAKKMAEIGGTPMPEPTLVLERESAPWTDLSDLSDLDEVDDKLEPYTGSDWK